MILKRWSSGSELIESRVIKLCPSRFLMGVMGSITVLSLVSIALCEWARWVQLGMGVWILSYVGVQCKKYIFLTHPTAIVALYAVGGRSWRLLSREGKVIWAIEGVYSYRSSVLIVLYFERGWDRKKVKVPIAFDATATLNYIRVLSKSGMT